MSSELAQPDYRSPERRAGRPSRMRGAMRGVNALTLAGGALLLVLSLWPGFVVGCLLVLAYPVILALGITWLVVVILGTRRDVAPPVTARAAILAPVVVCVTYVLLAYYVPRRIAFAACAGQFDRYVASAPGGGMPVRLGRWLGIYYVDEYAADPRGGVYFRTGTTGDGIGPDVLSYGFAYRPNRQGTPFGAARYSIYRLHGDWYWFRASDDWH
jgi:hypothetical protein